MKVSVKPYIQHQRVKRGLLRGGGAEPARHHAPHQLADMIDGRKRFRGEIVGADDETFSIRLPDAPMGVEPVHTLPLALLADAKLVMTDALLDAARERQQAEPDFDDSDGDIETIIEHTDGADADERNQEN